MPVHQRGLLLVGMRGAGKSAAGRAAAALAHLDFIDLDDQALALCGGPDVAAAFAERGGAARWRAAERDALEALIGGACPACIIAIGAGAPEHAPTAAVIQRARSGGWRVMHMRASADVCASRVAADPGGRPALTSAGLVGEIATLHARRTPIYESLCDLAVDADRALADVALSIARAASDS